MIFAIFVHVVYFSRILLATRIFIMLCIALGFFEVCAEKYEGRERERERERENRKRKQEGRVVMIVLICL